MLFIYFLILSTSAFSRAFEIQDEVAATAGAYSFLSLGDWGGAAISAQGKMISWQI